MSNSVTPGINDSVPLRRFAAEEHRIVERVSKEWYVTNGNADMSLGSTSRFHYALIKPTAVYQEMFNLDREIVMILSPYPQFEPRTLDAITDVVRMHQALRIDRICSVVVSRDDCIEDRIAELLKNDREMQIVVPFSYAELLSPIGDAFFLRNRFTSMPGTYSRCRRP